MTPLPFRPRPETPDCGIRTHATVEVPLSGVAAVRDLPSPAGSPPLPPRFLRHCDEQTVVAVRAVLDALARLPEPLPLDRCGVVAAPCQAGRIATARSLAQLRVGGAVTVSPHIVPQCSLHSLAGAVSVALGMHGPHLGIGGGPDALAEGLFAAMTLFHGGAAAGCDAVWLLASAWDDEPVLDASGTPLNDPVCRAVALLLVPDAEAADARLTLTLDVPGTPPQTVDPTSLAEFCRAVEICAAGSALTSWGVSCPWGTEVRLAARAPAVRMPGSSRREAA
jgi:hypothetical protein